jgi:8-oxo-dGTP diphosphatase
MACTIYRKPPPEYKPIFVVSGCYCESGGKLLYLKTAPPKKHQGTWTCAGGKCEEGESPLDCVVREVLEETGIRLNPKELTFCGTYFVRYPDCDFTYHIFHVRLAVPVPKVTLDREHEAFCWVTREEALKLPLILGEPECLELVFSDLDNRAR